VKFNKLVQKRKILQWHWTTKIVELEESQSDEEMAKKGK
jgi:hypothetical protein